MNQGAWVIVIAMAFVCAPALAEPAAQVQPAAATSTTLFTPTHEARRVRLSAGLKPALRPKLDATILEVRKLAQPPVVPAGKPQPVAPDLAAVARASLGDLARAEKLDIEMLVQLVMLEAARDADQDVRALLAELKAANERKAALRAALAALKSARQTKGSTKACASLSCLDELPPSTEYTPATMAAVKQALLAVPETGREENLSEASSSAQLRLQMAMDRKSKLLEVLSNLLKSISNSAQSITQNLK